jgi:hypothetical protein
MKAIRKISKRMHKTSFLGLGVGIAYEFIPNLQGILPAWWYLGVFGVILVLHAIQEQRDGDD